MREDSEEDDLPGMKMTETEEEMKDTVLRCCLLYADEDIFVMFTHFYNKFLSHNNMKERFIIHCL